MLVNLCKRPQVNAFINVTILLLLEEINRARYGTSFLSHISADVHIAHKYRASTWNKTYCFISYANENRLVYISCSPQQCLLPQSSLSIASHITVELSLSLSSLASSSHHHRSSVSLFARLS